MTTFVILGYEVAYIMPPYDKYVKSNVTSIDIF